MEIRAAIGSQATSPSMLSLETERLLLRPFRDTDIDAYAAMCADPDVMRYVGDGGTISRDVWRGA